MRLVVPTLLLVALALLTAPRAAAWEREMRVPLRDGTLHLADLTESWRAALRLDRLFSDEQLDATIDLRGLEGSLFIQGMNAALKDGWHVAIEEDHLVLRLSTDHLPSNSVEARRAARIFTQTIAPESTAAQRDFYGLLLPNQFDPSRPLVVLVHGLDCSRSNWVPLATKLHEAGHQVAFFTYPSDQPLADSAAFLADQMRLVRQMYPEVTVHLLTHSMGGLVARAYVEGDDYTGGVDRLMMIGPPNQGSSWAKLRVGLEIEEHLKLWHSEDGWSPSWMITDGLGEAGRDLSPGSEFLTELNARPRRSDVRYTIVAGSRHPLSNTLGHSIASSAKLVPEGARDWWGLGHTYRALDRWGGSLSERACASDGPVALDSAKLDGIDDFVVVSADHTSLYIPTSGQVEPPSWPIIIDRLTH